MLYVSGRRALRLCSDAVALYLVYRVSECSEPIPAFEHTFVTLQDKEARCAHQVVQWSVLSGGGCLLGDAPRLTSK